MAKRAKDLSGKLFGRLLVIRRAQERERKKGVPVWECRCTCGVITHVLGANLRSGITRSCGCLANELTSARRTKHKAKGTPEHNSWRAMRERCTNPNNSRWKQYGARGITYDPRWEDFSVFLADMGRRPPQCSLERVDLNAGYSKDNCVWAPPHAQSRNTSRTVRITHAGETKVLKDWAASLGITDGALRYRIKKFGLDRAMKMKKGERGNES